MNNYCCSAVGSQKMRKGENLCGFLFCLSGNFNEKEKFVHFDEI